jgi:signal transduction histidine kinase
MIGILEKKNQTLSIDSPDEPIYLCGDKSRLIQVLINITDNASKYSPPETEITIEITEQENHFQMIIRDQGYGFTEEELEKLFTPFPDISRPVNTEKSVGLGLSISHGIIKLHNGRIEATSEGRDKGSTFTITLPLHSEA